MTNRLTSRPYFSYFLTKQPYYPYFLGYHIVKWNKEHLKHVFLHWFSTINLFLLIKSLPLLPTMYNLVHFKLSFKNTLTSINCVKIHIFAVVALPESVDFFTWFIYINVRKKPFYPYFWAAKSLLLPYFLKMLSPTFALLFHRRSLVSLDKRQPFYILIQFYWFFRHPLCHRKMRLWQVWS